MIDKNDPRLTAYVLGELEGADETEIAAAINDMPELQQAVKEIESICGVVSEAFDEDLSFVEGKVVLSEPRNEVTKSVNSPRFFWVAACSIAILALFLGLVFINENPSFLVSSNDQNHNETNKDMMLPPTLEVEESAFRGQLDEAIANVIETDSGNARGNETPEAANLSMIVPSEKQAEGEALAFPDSEEWEDRVAKRRKFQELDLFVTESPVDLGGEDGRSVAQRLLAQDLPLITDTQAMNNRRPDLSGQSAAPDNDGEKFSFYLGLEEYEATIGKLSSGHRRRAIVPPDYDGFQVQNLLKNAFGEQVEIIDSEEALDSVSEDIAGNLEQQLSTGKLSTQEAVSDYYESSGVDDLRINQAQIALSVTMQRFGSTHPHVKELMNEISELQEARKQLESTVDDIIPILMKRVAPSGTEELEIKRHDADKIKLDPKLDFEQMEIVLGPYLNTQNETELLQGKSVDFDELKSIIGQFEERGLADKLSRQFAATANRKLEEAIGKHNHKVRQRRGWKRVEATGNTSRLIVGDKDELDLTGMHMHVKVDGFRARVLVDYFYYNDRNRQLEGNFKIRLPDDASLYYFAFGQSAYDFSPESGLAVEEFTDGGHYVSLGAADIGLARQDAWKNVKESKMVPREKAAFAYGQTVRRRVDPALVEWSGAGIFNARVFPLMPKHLHRIVVGYDVNLTPTDDGFVYRLELPKQTGQCRIDLNVADHVNGKWQLHLDKGNEADKPGQTTTWKSDVATDIQSEKRMHFDSPSWRTLTLHAENTKPVLLESLDVEKEPFFATQFKADLESETSTAKSRAVFLVDTSLSSRPEKFNVWLDLLRATLENNREDLKQFAVLFFDVHPRFWRESWTENTKSNVDGLLKDCYQIGLEGATNLHGAFLELAEAEWLTEKNQRPSLFLLSDGAANWGETNLRLLQRDLTRLRLGSLFAYQTGLSGTAISNLRYLAGSSGGAVFSVASENEVQAASTAHRNQPWKLESITGDGARDVMTAGRVEWIYPGQMVTVVGRGKCSDKIELELSQGERKKIISIDSPIRLESPLASRLYGQVSVGQLEALGESVFDISTAYARHFRVTGSTCSLLMLESDADYQRFNIKPQEDWFVVQSKDASKIVDNKLSQDAEILADPKAHLLAWIERLQNMPGMEFKMPTALSLAIDEMQFESIDSRLDIKNADKDDWSKKYAENLTAENLNSSLMAAEMNRRREVSVDGALRAYSNLIESNPGDLLVARDVAFTAMDLGRPDAAYHLLRRVLHQRPFEGSTYVAIGQCLDRLNRADMAIIFYELALAGSFQNQGPDFQKIVATHYRSLLSRIGRGELEASVDAYAKARLESLSKIAPLDQGDLVVTMMWNTDQTDVDLHIVEPSGEECFYQHKVTKSGGKITTDKTDGFGPEMYSIASAPQGRYEILAKFFASNQNRTNVSNKVYLTIYKNFGTKNEELTRKSVTLDKVNEKVSVHSLDWK